MTTTPSKPIHVLRSLLRHLKTGQAKATTAAAAATTTTKTTSSSPRQQQQSSSSSSSSSSSLSPTQSFVLQQYRAHRQSIIKTAGGSCNEKEEQEVVRLKQLVDDVLVLQRELRAREELYQMDASAETALTPMEMSRRAAARAGLQLPDLNPKLE